MHKDKVLINYRMSAASVAVTTSLLVFMSMLSSSNGSHSLMFIALTGYIKTKMSYKDEISVGNSL